MKRLLKYKKEIFIIIAFVVLVIFLYQDRKLIAPTGEKDNAPVIENVNPFAFSKVNDQGIVSPTETKNGISYRKLFLGRSDPDIQSILPVYFEQPENIEVELQGVDAQSGNFIFRENGKEIFSATHYDHTNVNIFRADPLNFSQVSGHTIMIAPGEDKEHPALLMFRKTLKIGGLNAFQ